VGTIKASRRFELSLIVLILLGAAVLRIANLTRLPPGFSNEEITNIRAAETARSGVVASFYNTGDPAGGREGLYPILESMTTSLLGEGLFSFRMLSVWCGLLSVALMYTLTRRLFGRFAGFSAALALVVSLWPIILSRSVLRETLLLPLILAMLLVLIRALHLGRIILPDTPTTSAYALLGILIALAAYTHWTGLLAAPIVLIFVIYLIASHQPMSRRVVGFIGFTLLVALILCIPYFTFTLRSIPMSGIYIYWANRPETVATLISTTLKTLASIVLIGDSSLEHNLPGYALIGPVGAVLLIVGIVTAARQWRGPNMMLALLTLVIGLFPAVWLRTAPDFTAMIVALPGIMALTGLGAASVLRMILKVRSLFANRQATTALLAIGIISGGIAASLVFQTWPRTPGVERAYHSMLGHLAIYLDQTRDSEPTSICSVSFGSDSLRDLALLDVMMHHEVPNLRFSNCTTGIVFANGGDNQRFTFLSEDSISPIFTSRLMNAQPVMVEGLPPGSVVEINVKKELADLLGKLTQAHVEWAPETVNPGESAQAALPVRMGGYLTFLGYDIDTSKPYKPGDVVSVVSYWRADGNLVPDLRLFVHILRYANTVPVLQNDIMSTDPQLLRDRDIFVQIAYIPLPADFPGGEYQISVGAYSSTTGERLPVYDSNRERGDRLFLDHISVQESAASEK
jgi:4-amino-4-deoxy-L-arabinose transferase-like glycosyltransferase